MNKTVLITGAAKRIGRAISRYLHKLDMDIIVHYHTSKEDAESLVAELNSIRPESATCLSCNLLDQEQLQQFAARAYNFKQRLDVLINNASSFYPVRFMDIEQKHWDDLIGTNMKAPLFLGKA